MNTAFVPTTQGNALDCLKYKQFSSPQLKTGKIFAKRRLADAGFPSGTWEPVNQ
jgi:hypothetical protein